MTHTEYAIIESKGADSSAVMTSKRAQAMGLEAVHSPLNYQSSQQQESPERHQSSVFLKGEFKRWCFIAFSARRKATMNVIRKKRTKTG